MSHVFDTCSIICFSVKQLSSSLKFGFSYASVGTNCKALLEGSGNSQHNFSSSKHQSGSEE